MDKKYVKQIADALGLEQWQVGNTLALLEYGATIPFISRYRKDRTGGLNEIQISQIRDLLKKLQDIDARRETVLHSIEKQGKLTPALKEKILAAKTLNELEDLYLPFKPKKRTRGKIAREKGLEPLAKLIFSQENIDLEEAAEKFLNDKVQTVEEALAGARDIIAEDINEDYRARQVIRKLFENEAVISSKVIKGKEDEGKKYQAYFDFSEPLKKSPSHRILAMFRGEKEKILKVDISVDSTKAIGKLEYIFLKNANASAEQVRMAIADSYKRLIKPSIETEFRHLAKERADEEAIKVFSANLRNLLLAPPLGKKRVLAIDPGFKTGCKVVCLNENGDLLFNTTIYPHSGAKEAIQAAKTISNLVEQYKIDVIALGNGTASFETERFLKKVRFKKDVKVFVVDESGASVYSASKIAREEFPDYDVTVRGAVSIGRRLIDPLAELVKIDPKSIGVGQYQHDVNQTKLKESLDQTVEWAVNLVGVNLNTASKYLLMYVSGLGKKLAENIIEHRQKIGRFVNRKQLLDVKLMGEKTFEQAAGFLRIPDGDNPLDNTAVHPEAYYVVEKMAKDLGVSIPELIKNAELRKKIDINRYIDEKVGIQTLTDIMKELEKPGRDPREEFKILEFDENIRSIEDLKVGMILPGIVKNVTKFGAFVDIGIKTNGLVHISEMADHFIKDPVEIVKVHQHVRVKVIGIDLERQRISLSMKNVSQQFD